MPKKKLIKNLHRRAVLVKIKLEVPQEYYRVDYQKQLEQFRSHTGLPSRPSVDELVSRYEYDIYNNPFESPDWRERLDKEREEIDKLVQRMIPDDPMGKFLKFIEELEMDGIVPKRKSNLGLSSKNIDSEIEGKSDLKGKTYGRLSRIKLFFDVEGLEWKDISLKLVSNSELIIKVKDEKAKRFNYSELGLNNIRNGNKPIRIWGTIKIISVLDGQISYDELRFKSHSELDGKNRKYIEKSVSELRKFLKNLTGINDDPFNPFNKKIGYQTKFRIRDDRPYQYLDSLSIDESP